MPSGTYIAGQESVRSSIADGSYSILPFPPFRHRERFCERDKAGSLALVHSPASSVANARSQDSRSSEYCFNVRQHAPPVSHQAEGLLCGV